MKKRYSPIRVNLNQEMRDEAALAGTDAYNKLSFKGGGGNILGRLGELMFEKVAPEVRYIGAHGYDYAFGATKIEIKTKAQSVPHTPPSHWEGSVAIASLGHQHPHWFVFCRIYRDKNGLYQHGWVVGRIPYDMFMKKSRGMAQGQFDSSNGYEVQANCRNIFHRDLMPMKRSAT